MGPHLRRSAHPAVRGWSAGRGAGWGLRHRPSLASPSSASSAWITTRSGGQRANERPAWLARSTPTGCCSTASAGPVQVRTPLAMWPASVSTAAKSHGETAWTSRRSPPTSSRCHVHSRAAGRSSRPCSVGMMMSPWRKFLAWRKESTTRAVRRVVEGLHDEGLRTALDIFTPALAPSVGQDLVNLSGLGDWAKSMTYVDAIGPASMPYELRGYAGWLRDAGEAVPRPSCPAFLASRRPVSTATASSSGPCAWRHRGSAARSAGVAPSSGSTRWSPGVCEVRDEDFAARLREILVAGVGVAPSWDLLFIGPERTRVIAGVMESLPRR